MGTYADERAITVGIDTEILDDSSKYWTMRNGKKIKISKMTNKHLSRVIGMLDHRENSPKDAMYDALVAELANRSNKPIMRDRNVVKYRKLLKKIQWFGSYCKHEARVASYDNHTDFERGREAGYHDAINDVLRFVSEMERDAEYDWNIVKVRENETFVDNNCQCRSGGCRK